MPAPVVDRPELTPEEAAESNLGWILGVNGTFHVLAIVFVALRMWTRVRIVKTFGKDDVLMLLAIGCAFGGGAVTYIMAAHYGLGRHRDAVSVEDYTQYLKLTFVQALVSTIGSLLFLKLSIGFSLIRMNQQKWYTRITWGFICFVILYTIVSYVEWFLVCKPLEKFWNKSLEGTCLPVATHKAFALLNTTCNILTDIAFATLPVPIIWSLQMPKKTRVYLIGILSLGYLAVMIGIVKVVCQNVFRGIYDQSFHNWIQFWGFLQINVGIIAACAPTLRPLFSGVLNLSSNGTSRGYHSNPNSKYGAASRNTGIMSTHRTRSNGWVKTTSQEDDYELDDRYDRHGRDEYGNRNRTNIGVGIDGSRSGSEEMIIQGGDKPKGIVATTVITVT
ncbi:integral membrane protein [Sarocladium implicatum]|nr:integral membrane protein [Sarocladium implicatum]